MGVRTCMTTTRHALALLLLLLGGCSSQFPLLEEVSSLSVTQLERELATTGAGGTRPAVRLRRVEVTGSDAAPGDADRVRSGLAAALAESESIDLVEPPASLTPTFDLDVSIEPSPVRRDGDKIAEDGARVAIYLFAPDRPEPVVALPLQVLREFSAGWVRVQVHRERP